MDWAVEQLENHPIIAICTASVLLSIPLSCLGIAFLRLSKKVHLAKKNE